MERPLRAPCCSADAFLWLDKGSSCRPASAPHGLGLWRLLVFSLLCLKKEKLREGVVLLGTYPNVKQDNIKQTVPALR